MTGITVDVNDEWLKAIISAFDSVEMDFIDSEQSWGYGGGRDLSQLAESARAADAV